jgi:hypothetical protein
MCNYAARELCYFLGTAPCTRSRKNPDSKDTNTISSLVWVLSDASFMGRNCRGLGVPIGQKCKTIQLTGISMFIMNIILLIIIIIILTGLMMVIISINPFGQVDCGRPLRGARRRNIQPHTTLHRGFLAIHCVKVKCYLLIIIGWWPCFAFGYATTCTWATSLRCLEHQ